MNVKRYFWLACAGILTAACSNDKTSEQTVPEGIATYVNVSVKVPGKIISKAPPEDYNPDGTYEGDDGVETLDIYMVSSTGVIEARRFTGNDISSTGEVVAPSQPFRTTSGYKTVYVVLNDPDPLQNTITSEQQLVEITGLARRATVNGQTVDEITMTGKSGQITIEPDVPVQDVVNGTNQIAVTVSRVAAKAIVTTTASTTLVNTEGVTLGTLSDITYSVAQYAKEIYWIEQPDYVSYGYDYVPTLGNYYDVADTYYDYTGLDNPAPVVALPVEADGYKSLPGTFLFETTHEEGPDQGTTDYRKGNTAYVLVRATLTPTAAAIADGGTLTNGTFYVGQTDGLIYSSKQAAQNAVQNQKVAVYLHGTMLYYAWLNPDSVETPMNSPVIRNNIYHINITGFTRIGFNWNPLYPEDPDTTTPENPDPKPVNPDEPDYPVDPTDPLTPEETYMTVEITVQDWWVHSYDIEY